MNFSTKPISNGFSIFIAGWLLFFIGMPLYAQQLKPDASFRPPLNSTLYLTGTFGELRSGHLHSGIDIKTGNVVGKKVFAVDDGYISRIKVSLAGYGKALYITHPNGYMSVYGHLQRFNDSLEKFVKGIQYKRQHFTVEIYPKKGRFTVKKGQLIAFSGDTGGADGPHLHFEIRDAKSQHPLNPLLFKAFRITDNKPPKLVQLAIYPVGVGSTINGKQDTVFYWISGKGMKCFIKGNPLIKVRGRVSFGIRAYDVMNGMINHDGVYQIELFEDHNRIFNLIMNRISFQTTRYVNSLIDYHYFQEKGRRIVRTQVDTNNRLIEYHDVLNRGISTFNDSNVHHYEFRVKDAFGNESKVPFRIQRDSKISKTAPRKQELGLPGGIAVNFRNVLQIDSGRISLYFVPNSFYQSFIFHFHEKPETKQTYSPLFILHNRFVPVQKYFTLSILPNKVDDSLKSKLFIAYLNPVEADAYSYVDCHWDKDRLVGRTRELGTYTVMADTIAPEIKALNFAGSDSLKTQKSLRLSIVDHETGIKDYRPTLNGHWILMEYSVKAHELVYHFDRYLKKGWNKFQLQVSDQVGNKRLFKASLYRK